MNEQQHDPYFKVSVIASTPNPQTVCWYALHQDYSDKFVADLDNVPTEERAGEVTVERCLKFGHFGVAEHPQITLNCGWFPHSTMQQIRTHRVGISVDCQSFRYTGKNIAEFGKLARDCALPYYSILEQADKLFYLRPVGKYLDRNGAKAEYTAVRRYNDLTYNVNAAIRYCEKIEDGFSEEQARGQLPFDIRQHWVISLNLRSLMHLLNVRFKKDAQWEAQEFCRHILPHFKAWTPQVYEWWESHGHKLRLAP